MQNSDDNYKCSNPMCDYKTYIIPGKVFYKPPKCPKCNSDLQKIGD